MTRSVYHPQGVTALRATPNATLVGCSPEPGHCRRTLCAGLGCRKGEGVAKASTRQLLINPTSKRSRESGKLTGPDALAFAGTSADAGRLVGSNPRGATWLRIDMGRHVPRKGADRSVARPGGRCSLSDPDQVPPQTPEQRQWVTSTSSPRRPDATAAGLLLGANRG